MGHQKISQNKKFFDAWAKSYDRFIFRFWMRFMQRKGIEETDLNGKSKVLDVACGTGYLLNEVSRYMKKGKIAGIDLSKNMVMEAKKKLGKKADIRQAQVEKMPYKKETFDYVLCTEAFHHFSYALQSLKEMKRVLKKSGRIVIVDINIPPTFLGRILFKIEPGFVQMYSKKDMRRLARKVGLRVVKQKRAGVFALIHVFERDDFMR